MWGRSIRPPPTGAAAPPPPPANRPASTASQSLNGCDQAPSTPGTNSPPRCPHAAPYTPGPTHHSPPTFSSSVRPTSPMRSPPGRRTRSAPRRTRASRVRSGAAPAPGSGSIDKASWACTAPACSARPQAIARGARRGRARTATGEAGERRRMGHEGRGSEGAILAGATNPVVAAAHRRSDSRRDTHQQKGPGRLRGRGLSIDLQCISRCGSHSDSGAQ